MEFGEILCWLVLGLAIQTLIGAAFLRAAVSLYNKMAGRTASPSGVPEPSYGKAIRIAFVSSLVYDVVLFGIGVMSVRAAAGGFAKMIAVSASFLVLVTMLTILLPTTSARAFLVALCYMVIVVVVVAVFAGVFALISMGIRAT